MTWRGLPGLAADDRLAAQLLQGAGVDVVPVAWDDAAVDWAAFDAVVLRSTWDYHLRAGEFETWLARMEHTGVRLWNPAPLVRWNAHKGYLVELAGLGLPVVSTTLIPRGRTDLLTDTVEKLDGRYAVAKPAVAASAFGIRRIRGPDARDPQLLELCDTHDLLIQPFLEEVASRGEWSLVFIDGEFSHAVRKHPAPGDFRVQAELGGSTHATPPPHDIIDAATRILGALRDPWLHARVDGVETGDGFQLMELELIEPSLFLDLADGAAARFAAAIVRKAGLRG